MGRSLEAILAGLPAERRRRVEERTAELEREVDGLADLRRLAGKAQADVASSLRIKQPSVSKIERQADLYLSTLRSYVEAIGGRLELVVTLPSGTVVRLEGFGDMSEGDGPRSKPKRSAPATPLTPPPPTSVPSSEPRRNSAPIPNPSRSAGR